jgi:MFS family permease
MEETPNSKTLGHYFLILGGHTAALFGSSVVHFLIIWWITVVSSSHLVIELAMFVVFLPLVIALPFAGVLSDILNRKLVLLITNAFNLFTTFILIFLFAFGTPAIGLVLIVLIIRSIPQAFYQPTFFAILPSMVSQKHLGRINGFAYFLTFLIQMFGPFFASFLLLVFPLNQIFWIEVVTIVNAIIPLLFLKIPHVKEKKRETGNNDADSSIILYFKELLEGLKAVIFVPGVIIVIVSIIILEYVSGLSNIMLSYYISVVHGAPFMVVALIHSHASWGIFIGCGVFVIKKYWNPAKTFFFLSIILALFGNLVLILAPYQWFGLIIISRIITGFSVVFVYSIFSTIIQTTVPKDKLGRVSSIYFAIISCIIPIASYQLSLFLLLISNVGVLLGVANLVGIALIIILYIVVCLLRIKFVNYKIQDEL